MRVAVIGSGLAGSFIAKTLSDLGADVLVLEKGKGSPIPKTSEDFEFSHKASGMRYTRTIGLGGTTSAWHSGLMRLQQSDLDQWFEHEEPQRRSQLNAEIMAAYDVAERSFLDERRLLLSEIEGQGSYLLHALGVSGASIRARPIRVLQPPINTFEFFRLGQARAYPKLQVIDDVSSIKFVGGRNGEVRAVEFTTGRGDRECAEVDVLVIATGGVASPKLVDSVLQDLGLPLLEANGRFYVDHPMGFLFRLAFKKPMTFGELFGRRVDGEIIRFGLCSSSPIDGLNHLCYLRPASSVSENEDVEGVKTKLAEYRGGKYSPLYLLRVLQHFDILLEAFSFRFGSNIKSRYATVMMVCEQEQRDDRGFVNAGDGRPHLRWFVSDRERRSIDSFVEFISDELRPILDKVAFDRNWKDSRLHSAAHHSGMCRIGSPSRGVVDSDLRIHGTENVFVCDGSVLPTTGHANTGLTIAALAIRLAHSLAGRELRN